MWLMEEFIENTCRKRRTSAPYLWAGVLMFSSLVGYGSAGLESTGVYWLYLVVFTVVLLAAARWILLRSVRGGGR